MRQKLQRPRPNLERLEERAVPTFTSSQISAGATGNFTATIRTDQPVFEVNYDGVTDTLTLVDATSSPLVISGVTGNVVLTLSSTAGGTFLTDVRLRGTFAGNLFLTINRALPSQQANVDFDTPNGEASILGNLRIITNAGGNSNLTFNTSSPVTVVGSVNLFLNAGGPAARKSVGFGSDWTIRGNLTVPNVNNFTMLGGNSVLGGTSIRTRATSQLNNTVSIMAGTTLERLSLTLGNVSASGSSTVVLGGVVESFTTISMGANTGGPGSNSVTLNGFVSFGSLVSISGKNGSKAVNIYNVTAPLARFIVVLGNALDNRVDFQGSNQFLFTTLVGGTGINRLFGVVPTPNRVYRFIR